MEEGKKPVELGSAESAKSLRISLELRRSQAPRAIVRIFPKDRELWLTDRSQLIKVEGNGVRSSLIAGGKWPSS
ncbi:hypothetical protein [Candidatus Methylacidithermus pantelleriae]|uniref:hypothetical protein n=1 Tax=Candidatus Methylacidithermus pantelleriae TaxID=2744239 RepID=UPI00157BCA60|nr:hypothetical protein [Candidatus Methylacidithermus pantelleriae]